MNAEERAERRAQMLKCLEIAMDVWTLLADAMDKGEDDIHIDAVSTVIRKRFEAPLHQSRIEAVGYSIAQAINCYGSTSCGIWAFAHNLDHCLFEDDLAEIELALDTMR